MCEHAARAAAAAGGAHQTRLLTSTWPNEPKSCLRSSACTLVERNKQQAMSAEAAGGTQTGCPPPPRREGSWAAATPCQPPRPCVDLPGCSRGCYRRTYTTTTGRKRVRISIERQAAGMLSAARELPATAGCPTGPDRAPSLRRNTLWPSAARIRLLLAHAETRSDQPITAAAVRNARRRRRRPACIIMHTTQQHRHPGRTDTHSFTAMVSWSRHEEKKQARPERASCQGEKTAIYTARGPRRERQRGENVGVYCRQRVQAAVGHEKGALCT